MSFPSLEWYRNKHTGVFDTQEELDSRVNVLNEVCRNYLDVGECSRDDSLSIESGRVEG